MVPVADKHTEVHHVGEHVSVSCPLDAKGRLPGAQGVDEEIHLFQRIAQVVHGTRIRCLDQ